MAESALCLIVLICVIEFGARQASLSLSLLDSDMLFAPLYTEPVQSVVVAVVVVYSECTLMCVCVDRFPFFGEGTTTT